MSRETREVHETTQFVINTMLLQEAAERAQRAAEAYFDADVADRPPLAAEFRAQLATVATHLAEVADVLATMTDADTTAIWDRLAWLRHIRGDIA